MGSPDRASFESAGYAPESAASKPKSEMTAVTAPISPESTSRRASSTAGKQRLGGDRGD